MVPLLGFSGLVGAVTHAARAHLSALPSFDIVDARKSYSIMGMTAEDSVDKQIQVRAALARALARYPAVSLDSRLKGVFVVRQLWFGQTFYGGINTEDRHKIILMVGTWPTVDETWLEHTFHHEFAHALLRGGSAVFPEVAWHRANEPGFAYSSEVEGAGGYAALQKGKTGRGFDPKLNEQGLLSEYATATFDEDWACIAEEVVADNPAFWELLPKYPRLREKARLAIEFYRRAMPGIRLRSVASTGS